MRTDVTASSTTGAIEKGSRRAARPVTPPPQGLSRGKRARSSRSTEAPAAAQAVRARRACGPGADDDRVVATHGGIMPDLTGTVACWFNSANGFGGCAPAIDGLGPRGPPRRGRGRLGERVLGHQGAARPRLRRRGRRPPPLSRSPRPGSPFCSGASAGLPGPHAPGRAAAGRGRRLRGRRLPHLPERRHEVHDLRDSGARDRPLPRAHAPARRRPRAGALEPAPGRRARGRLRRSGDRRPPRRGRRAVVRQRQGAADRARGADLLRALQRAPEAAARPLRPAGAHGCD